MRIFFIVFICLSVFACKSTATRNIKNDAPDSRKVRSEKSLSRISSKKSFEGKALTIRVTDSADNSLEHVMVISAGWPGSWDMQLNTRLDPNLPMYSLDELKQLVYVNTPNWLDIPLIEPAAGVRYVGVSNAEGFVIDSIPEDWLKNISDKNKQLTIPYIVIKKGYKPVAISKSIVPWSNDGKLVVVLEKDGSSLMEFPEYVNLFYREVLTNQKGKMLVRGRSVATGPSFPESGSNNNKSKSQTELLNDLISAAERANDIKWVCRFRFWQGHAGVDNPDYRARNEAGDEVRDRIKQSMEKIIEKCESFPHIYSLALIDLNETFNIQVSSRGGWLNLNDDQRLAFKAQTEAHQKQWLEKAEIISEQHADRLWPAFHFAVAQLYGFSQQWEDQYDKLRWIQFKYPMVFGTANERIMSQAESRIK